MNDALLFLHFAAIAMGGAASLGLPVVGAITGLAPPEHRPTLGRVVRPLKMIGHTAIAILLVTGAIIATNKNTWSHGSPWFWIKLALVACLIAGIVLGGRAGAKAMAGDAAAAGRARMIGMLNILILGCIILAAVWAFH